MSIKNNNGDFIKKNISLKNNIVQTDDFYISKDDNEKSKYSNYDNINFPQNDNIINFILDNHQKTLINNFMKEQVNDIKKIKEKRNKIKNINFLERNQNLKDLYKWNNLFNKSKSISSYINNKLKNKIKNNTETQFENFKFPVVLIDLPEDDVKNIIYKTEHSLNYKDNKRIKNKKNDKMKKTKSLNLITKNSNFYNKYSPINSPRNNNINFNYNNCTKPSSITSPRRKGGSSCGHRNNINDISHTHNQNIHKILNKIYYKEFPNKVRTNTIMKLILFMNEYLISNNLLDDYYDINNQKKLENLSKFISQQFDVDFPQQDDVNIDKMINSVKTIQRFWRKQKIKNFLEKNNINKEENELKKMVLNKYIKKAGFKIKKIIGLFNTMVECFDLLENDKEVEEMFYNVQQVIKKKLTPYEKNVLYKEYINNIIYEN